jgi:hypothetical protein
MPMTGAELGNILRGAVGEFDLDWIIYQLVQGAVVRRDLADMGTNRAEKVYWKAAVSALLEFQSKMEEM